MHSTLTTPMHSLHRVMHIMHKTIHCWYLCTYSSTTSMDTTTRVASTT